MSQGLLRDEPADVEEPASAAARTDTRFDGDGGVFVRVFVPGGIVGRGRIYALEFQEKAGARGEGAPGRVPEAKIADLVQAAREDVLEEAAHELVSREAAAAGAG